MVWFSGTEVRLFSGLSLELSPDRSLHDVPRERGTPFAGLTFLHSLLPFSSQAFCASSGYPWGSGKALQEEEQNLFLCSVLCSSLLGALCGFFLGFPRRAIIPSGSLGAFIPWRQALCSICGGSRRVGPTSWRCSGPFPLLCPSCTESVTVQVRLSQW